MTSGILPPSPLPAAGVSEKEVLAKSIRKLVKKLKAIEELKAKDLDGLEANQRAKVASEAGLRAQLNDLEGQLAAL